jgi:predicted nucleic acid-binding protein
LETGTCRWFFASSLSLPDYHSGLLSETSILSWLNPSKSKRTRLESCPTREILGRRSPNVLVHASTVCSPLHIRAQSALQDPSASAIPLWISRQILREYLAILSRPQTFSAPVAPAALVADVVKFQTQFLIAEDGPLVTSSLLGLLSTYSFGGKHVPDANIVAIMQVQAIRQILTDNVADFSRFGSVPVRPITRKGAHIFILGLL